MKVTPWCLTLCNPMDCSPPGLSVHGNLQARILEWVDVPFSRGSSQPRGIEPRSPALQADFLQSEPPGKPEHQKNGCFQIVVPEKTLESPLDRKEIKPVNLKEINPEYSLEELL